MKTAAAAHCRRALFKKPPQASEAHANEIVFQQSSDRPEDTGEALASAVFFNFLTSAGRLNLINK
ncbi:hypothetical protein JQX08_16515 [Pseudomonas sp. UL073]|uniref:Uncharacterized protein n=1 Tax=Zestomonas insulae TaxID=2809017 RepID=A0ABS2IGX5_9GAMM|nr:hypothetical protein [Pseudomonas insulae]MBM7062316.1 hypothetical protein [Pseudomonas insulae]